MGNVLRWGDLRLDIKYMINPLKKGALFVNNIKKKDTAQRIVWRWIKLQKRKEYQINIRRPMKTWDSLDETTIEYPSRDYRQIDQMLEERRNNREQTPKRDLNQLDYQPQRLMSQNRIELNLPQNSWMLHRDTVLHEIYPMQEDEGEKGLDSSSLL